MKIYTDVKMSARQWVHTLVDENDKVVRWFPRLWQALNYCHYNYGGPITLDIEGDLYDLIPQANNKKKDKK